MQKWEYLLIVAHWLQEYREPETELELFAVPTTGRWIIYSINGKKPQNDNLEMHLYLDELGDEGWELVSHQSLPDLESFTLKRPKY